MKYLHPKKIWCNLVNAWYQWLFQMEAYRVGVTLEIGKNVRFRECHIACYNGACGCSLVIADGADLRGANFAYFGNNGGVRMGGVE